MHTAFILYTHAHIIDGWWFGWSLGRGDINTHEKRVRSPRMPHVMQVLRTCCQLGDPAAPPRPHRAHTCPKKSTHPPSTCGLVYKDRYARLSRSYVGRKRANPGPVYMKRPTKPAKSALGPSALSSCVRQSNGPL